MTSPPEWRRILILGAAILGSVLLVGGAGWHWWQQSEEPESSAQVVLSEPPAIDPAGLDPVVLAAVEKARAAVSQAPESADAWGRLGMVLLAHGFSEQALPCLARAEQLDPHQVRWPYYQGTALLPAHPEQALLKLQRAVEPEAPGCETRRLKLAELLLESGRLEEAEPQFRRVLDTDIGNARAHLGLARLEFARQAFPASLSHLEGITDDPCSRKAAHLLLAEVHQRLDDRHSAQEHLRLAARQPNDRPWPDPLTEEVGRLQTGKQARLARADRLLEQNRAKEAIPLLQELVHDYPDSEWALIFLGRAYLQTADPSGAEAALRQAADLAPDGVEVQFYLGVALFQQGQFAKAANCFRQAIALRPTFADAHYNLGHCRLHQGDAKAAMAAFRTTLECKPNHAEAHTALGDVLLQQGQLAEARAHLQQAVLLKPDLVQARQLLEQVKKQSAAPASP